MESQYIPGRNAVMELLKTEKTVEKIYVLKGEMHGSITKILGKAKAKSIPIQYAEKAKLDELSENVVHQGVVALTTEYNYFSVDDILKTAEEKNEEPFIIILDGVEDPHNFGSIARTAECAGAHGIIIPKRRSATVTGTVYKTSAGAIEHLKVAQVTNLTKTIDDLKKAGLWIFGADMDSKETYTKTDLKGKIGIVIGAEGSGISRLVKEHCDGILTIPVFGKISSLNASNAASVLMYEVVRQRNGNI